MPVHQRSVWSDERGLSVVELLIATVISVIVLSAALEFYVTQHKNWLMQNDVAEVQQNARACIDEIAGTLRMAGFGLPAGHPAVEIGADSLTVYGMDGSGIDTVTYFIGGADSHNPYLMRHVNSEPAVSFSNDVESLAVREVSARRFEITLTTRSERPDGAFIGGDGYRRRTMTTEVVARNLAIH